MTLAVVGVFVVAVLAFAVASAFVQRRVEEHPCGVALSQADGTFLVRICDGGSP